MSHVHLFISAATAEFGSYRPFLLKLLDRPNVSSKVQENFITGTAETLIKLDDYISRCDAVIHLVGDMTGDAAKPASVAALRARYPDLAARLRLLAPFLEPDGPGLPYTHWEAWLALYHGKLLFIAQPAAGAPRDPRYAPTPAQRETQDAHLARLARLDRYPGKPFASPDALAADLLSSPILDLLSGHAAPRPGSRVARYSDLVARFGLAAAPLAFRTNVEALLVSYLGTQAMPVPFGGRSGEITALNAWLDGRKDDAGLLAGDAGATNLLISAPAGRGKTALLLHWIDQLRDDWTLIFVPVSIRAKTNEELTFYEALALELAAALNESLPPARGDPTAYYRDKVIEYLDRAAHGTLKMLLVVDGLDEARGWQMDTSVLPIQASASLRIVVSARELAGDDEGRDWLRRLGWAPARTGAQSLRVNPLTREGIADVLERMAFPVGPLSRDVDLIEELHRLSDGGDPVVLHYYAVDLLAQGERAARLKPADLQALKPGFAEYIRKWLDDQRKEWNEARRPIDTELVNAMLAVLACAHGPLKLVDLEALVTRVLPRAPIFTVAAVEPLQRFLIGDGLQRGYALAHPKLAVTLIEDYFARGQAVQRAERAFLAWLGELVAAVNAGTQDADAVPTYALLFYAQHLAGARPKVALPAWRALLEDGWRRAWESHEGGYQGLSRDVEAAARAFRTAADGDPSTLAPPVGGLAAQVRCALILSSIRSIGFGATGEVLAEFLRSDKISAQRAFYLALLKPDARRAETMGALIKELPDELRSQACASARDIADAEHRFAYLLAIVDDLSRKDQDDAYRQAARTVDQIKDAKGRAAAIERLRRKTPAELWATFMVSGMLAQAAAPAPAAPAASPVKARRPDRSYELAKEAADPDLPPRRIGEILRAVKDWGGYWAVQIVETLVHRMTARQQAMVLERVRRSDNKLFCGQVLAQLAGHGDARLVEEVVRTAIVTGVWDIELSLRAAAERSDAPLPRILESVLRMDDQYLRRNALAAIDDLLPPPLLAAALEAALQVTGAYATETIAALMPSLPPGRALEVIHSSSGPARSAFLAAWIPKAPDEHLADAARIAGQTADVVERGRLLASLLPRLRAAGQSSTIAQAYTIVFAIGDDLFGTLARVALQRQSPGLPVPEALREAVRAQAAATRDWDEVAALVRPVTVSLGAALLPGGEAAPLLDQCAVAAKQVKIDVARAFALGLLAAHGARIVDEQQVLAEMADEVSHVLAMLVFQFFRPPEELSAGLAAVQRRLQTLETGDDLAKSTKAIEFVGTLVSDLPADAILDALAAVTDSEEIRGRRGEDYAAAALAVLLLARRKPEDQVRGLRSAILDNLDALKHPEARALMQVLVMPHVPTAELWPLFRPVLEAGAQAQRPLLLAGLALLQGLVHHLFVRNPTLAGNRIEGSPLARLGGAAAVEDTLAAIEDVRAWWP